MVKFKCVILILLASLLGTFPLYADGNLQVPPGVVVPDDGEGPAGVVESYAPPRPQQPTQYLPPGTVPGQLPNPNSEIAIDPANANHMQEQCHVLDRDGNGLIKAYMADSGPNLEGDASAWIWVPRGECARLNAGIYAGIPAEILNKINPSDIREAQTIE